ncbi:uncharacterized protein PV09_02878 [Verruconis gallopava]|uniref:Succinate dehydrogenase assembly factor 4, mitochondrial n=1 Tax=Verruconis gallopava TaxID=253628 RepID=A0A0D1XUL0_9PEZI|nr:uncharacterized protein PV09_02878 [Verruconis gallopava]KIW06431.1 hypothetical protein PV09_02878 [Verruconis gallopava]
MNRLRRIPVTVSRSCHRSFTSTPSTRSSWSSSPAPPRLPKEEQEIFEKLQKQSAGAFSTPSPSTSSSAPDLDGLRTQPTGSFSGDVAKINPRVEATGDGEELHPHIRMGAKPEFEGDVNPKTGEVGGPKNEPLRWGGDGDWSYNCRVTDF